MAAPRASTGTTARLRRAALLVALAVLACAAPARSAGPRVPDPLPPFSPVEALLAASDPLLNTSSWQLARTRVGEAWDRTTGSSAVVVAVLDTGVAPDHPDLGPLAPGWDFVNDDADPADDNGHGTAVAGIVAARRNGEGVVGVCPDCTIMPVKVLPAAGNGSWEDVTEGIRWAVDHGAHVVNLSLGSNGAGPAVGEAVAYALGRGVVVVGAAGNRDTTDEYFPSAFPGVLSVGAVDANDVRYSPANGNATWGSSHGPWVRVAAPGCAPTTWLGGGYVTFCGTSGAAPFVSGLAGLLLSYRPLSRDGVDAAITGSAAGIGSDFGGGRMDAEAALASVGGAAPAPPPPGERQQRREEPGAGKRRTPSVAPDVSVALRASGGGGRVVDVEVASRGGTATGVEARIELPRGMRVGRLETSGGSITLRGSTLVWRLGRLYSGRSAGARFTATSRGRGVLTAQVRSARPDPAPGDNRTALVLRG